MYVTLNYSRLRLERPSVSIRATLAVVAIEAIVSPAGPVEAEARERRDEILGYGAFVSVSNRRARRCVVALEAEVPGVVEDPGTEAVAGVKDQVLTESIDRFDWCWEAEGIGGNKTCFGRVDNGAEIRRWLCQRNGNCLVCE